MLYIYIAINVNVKYIAVNIKHIAVNVKHIAVISAKLLLR